MFWGSEGFVFCMGGRVLSQSSLEHPKVRTPTNFLVHGRLRHRVHGSLQRLERSLGKGMQISIKISEGKRLSTE